MLLEIADIFRPERSMTLTVDHAVPFTFSVYPNPFPDPYYWCARNGLRTLLELKVERWTSAIVGGALVNYNEMPKGGVPSGFQEAAIRDGVPKITKVPPSKGDWPVRQDHHGEVVLYKSAPNFFLTFPPLSAPTQCLRSSRVGFFVNDKNLVGLGFFDLSTAELEVLDKSFLRKAKVTHSL